jgi:PAS domain S-box-containing protein
MMMKKKQIHLKRAAELRSRAETQFNLTHVQEPIPTTAKNANRLMHELQVHKIELDLQNEELKRTEDGLERYANLYDSAPLGYFTLGKNGAIQQVNLTGARLLGVERDQLVGARFGLFVANSDRPIFNTFLKKIFEGQGKAACEVALHKDEHLLPETQLLHPSTLIKDNFAGESDPCLVWINAESTGDSQSCHVVVLDISERKHAEERHKAEAELLNICHFAGNTQELIRELILYFKRLVGCQAMGVRLHQGDDFPYYETRGFSNHFVKAESSLCVRDAKGEILHDNSGSPILECMCGNILCERFDPSKPFFTEFGSFWSSNTTQLLATTTEADRQARTRNRCNREGYESVVLIPLRAQGKTYGLIQFNDMRRGLFNLEQIKRLEYLVGHVSLALANLESIEALKESEIRFGSLLQNVQTVAIQGYAPDGTTQYWNKGSELIYGYSAREAIGKNLLDLIIPPEMRQGVQQAIHSMATTGEPIPAAELSLMRKDGTRVAVYSSHTVVQRTGHAPELFCIDIDLSERKKIEDDLKTREHLLNKILDILPVGLWITDKNGQSTRNNPAGIKIWGKDILIGAEEYSALRARRLPGREEIPPNDWALSHTIREGVTVQDEIMEIDAFDGQKKTILNYTAPVLDEQGQVEAAVVVNLDITIRQHIEDTLLFLAQQGWIAGENFFKGLAQFLAKTLDMDYVCINQLEKENQIVQTLVIYHDGHFEENASYALKGTLYEDVINKTIYSCRNQAHLSYPGDITIQNRSAESFVGATLWSHLGQAIGLIAVIGRKPMVNSRLAEAILKLAAVRAAGELERKQKELELLEERALLKRRVEERTWDLSVANAELSKSLRLKDEFLANMSHELRTPLTGILGLSEALKLKVYGEINPRQQASVENIEKCGQHLLSLINDILDLSKVEAGMISLEPMVLSVREICQASILMVNEYSQNKKIDISVDINQDVEYIQADERRLKQILVNLLSNAVKFTPEGEKVGLVVKGDTVNQRIQFIVWDHGIGIAFRDLNRLFRQFTQLDSTFSKKYEGTGLGLSLVLKMVELHNGGISVESIPGRGSRFIVTLPWEVTEKTAAEISSPNLTFGTHKSNDVGDSLILVVEDNETTLRLLVSSLTSMGYRVVTARNGEEGIDQTRETLPDVILMDIHMPGLDGIQTALRIRADSSVNHIPIIALTALALSGDRENCFNAGMNDYLSKPVSTHELKKAIDTQILNKKESMKNTPLAQKA